MEYLLFGINVLLILCLILQDYNNRKEREKLELKLMSKDITEYKANTEPLPKPIKDEPDEYLDIDDVPTSKLLTAKDKL
jgi:hypothetical protein